MDNSNNFAGMYLSNEIRIDGLIRAIGRIYAAIHSHVVLVPANASLRDFEMSFAG